MYCIVFLQSYSEESGSDPDVDLENQYYNAKSQKEDNPDKALADFQKVLDIEGNDKGDWGFKALKQIVKINFKMVSYICQRVFNVIGIWFVRCDNILQYHSFV